MLRSLLTLVLSCALFPLLAGCQEPDRAQHLQMVKMQIGNKQFTLEAAVTDQEHQTGLMFRDSMPADHGMIFYFDQSEVQNFWMKNTRIALDIIYAAPDGTIVSIKQMQPFDLRGTSSEKPAQYAIELNEGAAAAAGAKVGDKLTIPAPPKQKPASTQSK
jgi:uncharacterized membrane protein (UPF0127 family)